MKDTLAHYIRNCYTCIYVTVARDQYHGLSILSAIHTYHQRDIIFDFMMGLPPHNGYNMMLILIDKLKK